MQRREFLKASLAGIATAMLPACETAAGDQTCAPNVILINCDDLGYGDLGCYGSKVISTPNVDALAKNGIRFTQFYAAPVCTPSRANLMTGRYAIRSGLNSVLFPHETIGIPDSEITVAELLKKRGYATACIGKWHLGCLPKHMPTRHGFDYYYGIPYSNDMGEMKDGYPNVPLYRNEEIIEQPAHIDMLTERYTEETIKFIRENKSKPFFVYLPHTMPHKPLYVSEKFKGRSKHGLYGDVVETIDWGVGEIVKALREEGLERNTIVMFTSDNGPLLRLGGSAGPLSGAKGSVFEGGMCVPFIASWPERIPAGKTCRQPASNLDMLPTLVTLAGGKVPTDRIIDGRNITPLLTASGRMPDYTYFYYPGGTVPAVRHGRWKLRLERGRQSVNEPELYNLDIDIREQHNVAKAHPNVVADLKAKADEFLRSLSK